MAERAIELVGAALLLALRLHVAVTAGASTSEFIEFGIGALRRRRVAGRTRHAGGGLGTTLRVFGNLLAADFGRIGAVLLARLPGFGVVDVSRHLCVDAAVADHRCQPLLDATLLIGFDATRVIEL